MLGYGTFWDLSMTSEVVFWFTSSIRRSCTLLRICVGKMDDEFFRLKYFEFGRFVTSSALVVSALMRGLLLYVGYVLTLSDGVPISSPVGLIRHRRVV